MRRTVYLLSALLIASGLSVGCTTPSRIEITPDDVVIDKAGKTVLLRARVLDQDGNEMSSRGLDINWYCEDTSVVTLTRDGVVTSVASGEAEVTAEIAETDVKATVTVEVKIPAAVQVSREKLRLEEGQTLDDVWAEVRTERGALIQGLKPAWSSENSDIVKVEPVLNPDKPRSFAKLTGVASGATRVTARYENLTKEIKVSVFGADEEVHLVGNHISKKKERDAKRAKKKKPKARHVEF
jgi:hypothetical protein